MGVVEAPESVMDGSQAAVVGEEQVGLNLDGGQDDLEERLFADTEPDGNGTGEGVGDQGATVGGTGELVEGGGAKEQSTTVLFHRAAEASESTAANGRQLPSSSHDLARRRGLKVGGNRKWRVWIGGAEREKTIDGD